MSESKSAGKVINVMTIGMDAKKQAIFRMAFKMYAVEQYRLLEDAPDERANLAIIDMDCVGAQNLWDEFRAKHPELPAVIVTVSPEADAPAPVLSKPVRMDALFPLLRKVLHSPRGDRGNAVARETVPASEAGRMRTAAVTTPVPPSPTQVPEPRNAVQPQALPEISAPRAEIRTYKLPSMIELFDAKTGLLHALRETRSNREPAVLRIEGHDAIIVLPSQDIALLLQDVEVLRKACEAGTFVEVRGFAPADVPRQAASQSLMSLLWQVSLWTSRGRLMSGIGPDMPLRLRHWPNLTRLAPIPDAMRVAALWTRHPVSLRLTVKMLNVPPEHVFDFLAAAASVGILETPRAGGAAVPPPEPPPMPAAASAAQGGLLSRLLRKIVRL